jgi:iron-sulfur cluster insertion protein
MNNTNFNINITESTKDKILSTQAKEKHLKPLKISVEGGGCSGFQYKYIFIENDQIETTDYVYYFNEKPLIIIDEASFIFLNNSSIDYVSTMTSSEFVIKNPNSTTKCGCGNSFNVM